MGKADQQAVGKSITSERQRSLDQGNQGINDTQSRVNQLIPRSDTERSATFGGYSDLAKGNREDMSNYLFSGPGGSSGGGTGGGGGVGGGGGGPSYLDTFNELTGKSGGYDPARLGRIEGIAGKLGDTSGNYGDVNTSISALQGARSNYGATGKSVDELQKFAATGGVSEADRARINRPIFEEFEKTGGYSDPQIADIRARSNAGAVSQYGALRDEMNRNKIASGQMGPGWSEAGFKLARQSSQDAATNARNTETDIADRVRAGRMDAAKTISGNQLALQPITSQNTLQGYGTAGSLDIEKNRAVQDAMTSAAQLGLSRQQQIDAAMEAAAGIEQGNQGLINQTRLGAASGLSQDTLGRMSIGASSAANAAALDAANRRFILSEENQNKATGLGGMLNTYGASPTELTGNQALLRGYRGDVSEQQQGLTNQQIQKGYMPGLGSSIMSGLNIAGKVAGIGGGIATGFGGLGGNSGTNKGSGPQFPGYMYPDFGGSNSGAGPSFPGYMYPNQNTPNPYQINFNPRT